MKTLSVLFVPVYWQGLTDASWSRSTIVALDPKVRKFYQESSHGLFDWTITVAPVMTLAPWQSVIGSLQGDELKTQTGFAYSDFDRVVGFLAKGGGSPTSNKGRNYGKLSLVFNCMGSEYVLHSCAHELGHSLLGHGDADHPGTFNIGKRSGNVITMPPLNVIMWTSKPVWTSDSSSIMGYEQVEAYFSAPEQARLGWITPVDHSVDGASYRLTPLSRTVAGAIYAVRVATPGSKRVYWIEYRVAEGFDAKINAARELGIVVRVEGDFGCYIPCRIETSPNRVLSGYPTSRNLLPGESMIDGTNIIECTAADTVCVRKVGSVVVVPPPPPDPNIATLGELQPLVAGLTPTITQAQKDQVAALGARLVVS